jgi:ABC-type Co2+ transport system permease subunit
MPKMSYNSRQDINTGWLLIFYWVAIIMTTIAIQRLNHRVGELISPLVSILGACIFVMGLALIHRAYARSN